MTLTYAHSTTLLAAALLALAAPCAALDATIGCTEFNGDLFLTTGGSADERTEMAAALGKLATACHSATDEEEDIIDEPIGLADWPDDDVSLACSAVLQSPEHNVSVQAFRLCARV